jgi:hypothetical protein
MHIIHIIVVDANDIILYNKYISSTLLFQLS